MKAVLAVFQKHIHWLIYTRTATLPVKGNTWNSHDLQSGRREGSGMKKREHRVSKGVLTDPAFRRFGSGVNLPPLPVSGQTMTVVEQ